MEIRRVRAAALPANPRADVVYQVGQDLYLGAQLIGVSGPGAAEAVRRAALNYGLDYGRKGSVLSNFATLADWSSVYGPATRALDSSNTFDGLPVLSFTPSSEFDGVVKDSSKFGSNTFSISAGAMIYLVVDLPDETVAKVPSFQLRFSSDNNATKSLEFTITPVYSRRSGRHVFAVMAGEDGTTDFGGQAWVAAGGQVWGDNFNFIRIISVNCGGTTVKFCSLIVAAKDSPKVVWTFDSASPSTINTIAPLFKAMGWKAAMMVDGDAVAANAATLRMLRDDYGWDIGCQGIGHINYTTGGNAALLGGHIDQCKAAFQSAGLPEPTLFAYPSNASSNATDATLISKGIKFARAGGNDLITPVGRGVPEYVGGMLKVGTSQPLGRNLAAMKKRVDQLIRTGGYLNLFTHGASPLSTDWSLSSDLSSFYQLCDYLVANGVACVAPSEVVNSAQERSWI